MLGNSNEQIGSAYIEDEYFKQSIFAKNRRSSLQLQGQTGSHYIDTAVPSPKYKCRLGRNKKLPNLQGNKGVKVPCRVLASQIGPPRVGHINK